MTVERNKSTEEMRHNTNNEDGSTKKEIITNANLADLGTTIGNLHRQNFRTADTSKCINNGWGIHMNDHVRR